MKSLTHLKEQILSKIKMYQNGYANLYYDTILKKYVNTSEEENVDIIGGISDYVGNYFLIIWNGEIQYTKTKQVIASKNALISTIDAKIISFIDNSIADNNIDDLRILLATDTEYVYKITKSYSNSNAVIQKEFSGMDKDSINKLLSSLFNKTVICIEFSVSEYIKVTNDFNENCLKSKCKKC